MSDKLPSLSWSWLETNSGHDKLGSLSDFRQRRFHCFQATTDVINGSFQKRLYIDWKRNPHSCVKVLIDNAAARSWPL